MSTETEKLRGTLHLLSLTGGAIRLEKKIASGTLGDVRMDTVSGTFSAAIEFLQMTTSKAQAFRFVAMEPVARESEEFKWNIISVEKRQ